MSKPSIDIASIANLAQIELSEDEILIFTEQIQTILNYFQKLEQLDTTGVAFDGEAIPLVEATRLDSAIESIGSQKSLLNTAASTQDNFQVPPVIDGNH